MHYKNGRGAANGDKVICLRDYGPPIIGVLYDAMVGNNDCNGKLAPISHTDQCPDLKDCMRLDDALALLRAKPA